MRRLYFLVPNVESAKKINDELLLARVEERHIHIIAKEGTPMEDLPEASLAQKSDVIPALQRGVAIGGITGVVAGIVAVTFPPAGLVLRVVHLPPTTVCHILPLHDALPIHCVSPSIKYSTQYR